MAVTTVQFASVASSAPVASQALTLTSPTTTGNLIAVAVSVFTSGTATTLTVTDNLVGNTYTRAGRVLSSFSNSIALELWYAKNIVGGSTHTITVAGAVASYLSVAPVECIGADGASPLEAFLSAGSGTAPPVDPGAVTASAGALVIGAVTNVNTVTYTPATGYTLQASITNAGSFQPLGTEVRGNVTAGAQDPTWTFSATSVWIALAASFKPPPPAGGGWFWGVVPNSSLTGGFNSMET